MRFLRRGDDIARGRGIGDGVANGIAVEVGFVAGIEVSASTATEVAATPGVHADIYAVVVLELSLELEFLSSMAFEALFSRSKGES